MISIVISKSMEAIGKLIKESECVLVCACKKYRSDERNQAEANYAMRLSKPIILVEFLDDNNNNDEAGWDVTSSGWLSQVARRSMARVSLVASSSSSSSSDKRGPRRCHRRKNGGDVNEVVSELMEHLLEMRNAERWSSAEVSAWFDSNRVHPSITQLYGVFDGFTLKQIYNMKTLTPEFYYQTLANETNHQITSTDIARFAQQLEHLFGKRSSAKTTNLID